MEIYSCTQHKKSAVFQAIIISSILITALYIILRTVSKFNLPVLILTTFEKALTFSA